MGGTQKHQLCLCIRPGLNASLDINRTVYLQAIENTEALVVQYIRETALEMKMATNATRGYYLIIAGKDRKRLPSWEMNRRGEMRTSGFMELGKERNGQIAVTTSDLLSLNRKYKRE